MSGSPLDAGKYLAEYALIGTTTAACVIPDAWALAGEFYKLQSDPGAQYEAGMAWLQVAQHLGDAVSAAESVNNSVAGTGWEGKDQEAYSAKVADYIRELMIGQIFAYTVGIALIISAISLFIIVAIAAVMATGLLIFMGAILAAIASVVGNLGASEALEADALLYAVECEMSIAELETAMVTLDAALAAGIGAFLAGDVGVQFAMGDHDALADLAQATVDGVGTIAVGLVAKLYQEGVGKVYGNPFAGGFGTVVRALGITDVVTGESIPDRASAPIDSSR
jgi:uncharacterized membrane protein